MNKNVLNVILIVGVIALVSGVAWYKSVQQKTEANRAEVAAEVANTEEAAAEAAITPAVTTIATPIAAEPSQTVEAVSVEAGESDVSDNAKPVVAEPLQGAEEAPVETAAAEASAKLPKLIDLGADKCIPCKKLAPILEELKKEYAGRLDVVFIDVWKHPDHGKAYTFNLIPTQILFDAEGEEVWRHVGFISKDDLKKIFAEKAGVK